MSDAYVMYDQTTGKRYAVCGSARVEIDPLVFDAMMETFEGDNNRLIAENTRLREVVADGQMHAREILAENARLREFAHGLIDGYECGRGELCDGCTWDGMSDPREFNCKVRAEARELGVTADD